MQFRHNDGLTCLDKKVGADPNLRALLQCRSFDSGRQNGIIDASLPNNDAVCVDEHSLRAFQCPERQTPRAEAVIQENSGWRLSPKSHWLLSEGQVHG